MSQKSRPYTVGCGCRHSQLRSHSSGARTGVSSSAIPASSSTEDSVTWAADLLYLNQFTTGENWCASRINLHLAKRCLVHSRPLVVLGCRRKSTIRSRIRTQALENALLVGIAPDCTRQGLERGSALQHLRRRLSLVPPISRPVPQEHYIRA